jgi:hypothetical protein
MKRFIVSMETVCQAFPPIRSDSATKEGAKNSLGKPFGSVIKLSTILSQAIFICCGRD